LCISCLLDEEDSDKFAVDEEYGYITALVAFDAEQIENVSFIVKATDHGDPSKSSLARFV